MDFSLPSRLIHEMYYMSGMSLRLGLKATITELVASVLYIKHRYPLYKRLHLKRMDIEFSLLYLLKERDYNGKPVSY
jgi:hypothetical protein